MAAITGRYVRTFAEANTGMLGGVSLNAPYEFFWVELTSIEGATLVCTGAGKQLRLPVRRVVGGREVATVEIDDPIFGPLTAKVHPFLAEACGEPLQGKLFA